MGDRIQMGKRKITTLRAVFWRFMTGLLTGLLIAIVVPWLLLLFLVNVGAINYADTGEKEANAVAQMLENVENTDTVLSTLSARLRYVVLDEQYQPKKATMTEKEQEAAVTYVRDGRRSYGMSRSYLVVERGTARIVLQYDIGSGYASEWMQEHLPTPEHLMVGLMVLNAISYVLLLIRRFEKRLVRQLAPLFTATKEIAEQNLEFEVGHSAIKEFDEVLHSFSEMKDKLKRSLEKQWSVQKQQREQIAALAHDIKTPLTVLQGNLDLLADSTLSKEQSHEVRQASEAAERMTDYIRLLMELAKVEAEYEYQFVPIQVEPFLQKIGEQGQLLCHAKNINWSGEMENDLPTLWGDPMMLERAVMNLIGNAIRYTKEGGEIEFVAKQSGENLMICIRDSGEGFSREALEHGRELFFMEEKNRSAAADLHIGMGLYITDTVVRRHQGKLFLRNRADQTGAEVIIQIPVKK